MADLFVALGGNIGVGKTTLGQELAALLGGTFYAEPLAEGYLGDYYADPKRWALEFQLFMLSERFEQHLRIAHTPGIAVEDRGILEDTIFARMLAEDGVIDARAFRTYLAHYGRLSRYLCNPDVILFLDATPAECLARVRERGRTCEKALPLAYLERLDGAYRAWLGAMEGRLNVVRLPWHDGDRDPAAAVAAVRAAAEGARAWRERWGRHLP